VPASCCRCSRQQPAAPQGSAVGSTAAAGSCCSPVWQLPLLQQLLLRRSAPLSVHTKSSPVGCVVLPGVHARGAVQLVLAARDQAGLVSHHHRRAARPEDRVGHEEVLVLPGVVAVGGDLVGDEQGDAVGVRRQHVAHQAHGHHADRAAHAPQVVGLHIAAELELVDEHGRQGGGGAEDGAVGDEDVDLLGLDAWWGWGWG